MAKLENSLIAWNTASFQQTLKAELETLKQDVLPLNEVVEEGNTVVDSDLGVNVIEVSDDEQMIHAKVGVFFAQIVDCLCCGESQPIDEAYCEMLVSINKMTAQADFKILPN